MKVNTLFVSWLTIIALLLQSCCKEHCSDQSINVLGLSGFSAAELSTVKVMQYTRNDFNIAIDSFSVSLFATATGDTTRWLPNKPLLPDFNFKVNIGQPATSYTITDFTTQSEDCNCSGGSYDRVLSYKLNGVQQPIGDGMLVLKK